MYGFSVNLGFEPDLDVRTLWREIEGRRDVLRVKGYELGGRAHGLPDPGFQAPLLPGERLDGDLTVLEAPTVDLPQAIPVRPEAHWGGHLNAEVRLGGVWRYREMLDRTPMRLLLIHVGTWRAGHGVGFWTESHVWLDQPENPLRPLAEENLRALAGRVEALARAFPAHLSSAVGNFHELKGPFDRDVERLTKAFAAVPGFVPNGG